MQNAASTPSARRRRVGLLLGLLAVPLSIGYGCSQPAPPPTAKPVQPAQAPPPPAFVYPAAQKVEAVDDYHGTRVADPYRWLEALDSKETREWVEAENKLTFGFLEKIAARPRIRERLTQLWNYERYTPPFRDGGRYFYSKNDGLQNQNVIYTTPSLSTEAKVLLDPNKLSQDGTVALSGMRVSDDGKLMAYGLATAGSDWQEWKVRNIETGADLADTLKWIKFSGASFTKDGKGFFYSRFAEPAPGKTLEEQNYFQKLYYHRIGQPQDKDQLVYERKDQKEWQFDGDVTEDGHYLIITVHKGTDHKYRVFYKDLQRPGAKIVELIDNFDNEYSFIGNDGPMFYFQTDLGAPRRRVVAIDSRKKGPKPDEIVPQGEETLEGVSLVNDLFVASYLKDAHAQVKIFDRKGKLVREVALPGIGTVGGLGGKRKDKETFYAFTSFNTPAVVYRLDLVSFESTVFKKPQLAFKADEFETKQVFFQSKDGTRVPMFVTHRKGLSTDGKAPTYLYGYGGFNVSITPYFSPSDMIFMEMGGVLAIANLRGGGEYGVDWHKAGTKANKQRVFDDFIAAAEWLVDKGYTRPSRLAIAGGSNGGLLVGACITQRPDLFGAALPAVGVMDMLRFHKFTIGWAWADDYGTSDNAEDFKTLFAYSPLHNIKPGTMYPPTFVTTADHDDRVVPWHSFKFTAALQAAQKGAAPVLIRIETKAGHGAGKPTSKKIEEASDRLAFLSEIFQMKAP